MAGFRSLSPKTRNLRAVGGTDELQVAIDKFEELKKDAAAGNSSNGETFNFPFTTTSGINAVV
jgi:hypothetical protein